jgi:anti-sigma regulatory factor (Ser/Thr protein kinase)
MDLQVKDIQSLQLAVEKLCVFLSEQGVSSERIFDSRLVANELLGNVLQHGDKQAEFCYEINDGHVHITVRSKTAFIPPKQSVCSSMYAEHGRGLFLVDSVCVERIVTEDGGIAVRIKIR